jgi:hypothetical protein
MSFAGMSYLAIVLAAVAAWIAGAVWYGVLGGPWVAAQGKTMEAFKAEQAALKGTPRAWLPFVLAFLAELVMAWVLAGVIGHLGAGQVTLRNGVISALFLWLGLVLTTVLVNNAFTGRKAMLTAIDAGHWLLVLLVMGAVIGGIGV